MDDQDIEVLMLSFRAVFEEGIRSWLSNRPELVEARGDVPLTTGFCRGAAAAVKLILDEDMPDGCWAVAGGLGLDLDYMQEADAGYFEPGEYPGGLRGKSGKWESHFWVEGVLPDGSGVIVDISADQFGHEDVVVTDAEDPRYKKNYLGDHQAMVRPREDAWALWMVLGWRNSRCSKMSFA